jgi:hypothetical protein
MPTHLWAPQIQVIIPDLIVNADQIDQWHEVTSNSVIGQRKNKKDADLRVWVGSRTSHHKSHPDPQKTARLCETIRYVGSRKS